MMRAWSSVVAFLVVAWGLAQTRALADSYAAPGGGWNYAYEANAGQDSPGTAPGAYDALDGTFGYGNNSDSWTGDGIGAGKPGGASVIGGSYLRVQDTGDPRDYGFGPDPSNRKLYLAHKTPANGISGTALNDGLTAYFRVRLPTSATPPIDDQHPDGGGGIVPWPAGGDGYQIHDNGKGNIAIHQAAGGLISFSLAVPTDHAEVVSACLMTNHLNGAVASGDVDTGDPGTPNLLPLDPTQWHEVWVTIKAGGAGTHQVTIYLDGSLAPAATFDVTAGTGDDVGDGYVAFGVGSTGQSGAIDIDYLRIANGVNVPTSVVVPVPALGGAALAAAVIILLAMGALLIARRRPALA